MNEKSTWWLIGLTGAISMTAMKYFCDWINKEENRVVPRETVELINESRTLISESEKIE